MAATKSRVMKVALDGLQQAVATANRIQLEEVRKFAAAKQMVADIPRYARLKLASAEKAWAAILFMDMRDSTARAQRVGPRATFIAMHTLLPAMALLVSDGGGYIVGFRGDGLFGAFGIDEHAANPAGMSKGEAVKKAAVCGQAMVEAVTGVVNPLLERFKLAADIRIGIGVDVGEIVITRIGLEGAHEVSAYGNAVNMASKLCGLANNTIVISPASDTLYPTGPNGKVSTTPLGTVPAGCMVSFPGLMLAEG